MENFDLNQIPELVKTQALNQQEVISILCKFILHNKPLFNLHNHDDDFVSEIIISFLENAVPLLNQYNSDLGSFSAYFYNHIIGIVHSVRKKIARKAHDNYFYFQDYIINNEDKTYKFKPLDIQERPKTPYAFKTITYEQIKNIVVPKIEKIDRKILILTIRSAFDVTDEQIRNICSVYNVEDEYLFILIEYIRKTLEKKAIRREELLERRNKAYYYHKKYESQIKYIDEAIYVNEPDKLKENLIKKNIKHTTSWQNHNLRLQEGCLLLRPSNKFISELLGICERQVSYYLYCSKHQVYFDKIEKKLVNLDFDSENI